MKKKVKQLLKHPLITGSTVIFFGTLLANAFNFFFTAYMLRNLPAGDKGTLFALISIITLPGLAANSIAPSIVNFAGTYFAKNNLGRVHGLYNKIAKFYMIIGSVFFVAFLVSIPFLSQFFKIPNQQLLFLVDVIVFLGVLNVINVSFLQAKLAFGYIAFISILSAILKFVLGIFFVSSGFAVTGAMYALILAAIIPLLLSFKPLRFIFDKKTVKEKVDTREIILYGLPSAVAILGLTSFITSDILLVKHFFPPLQADVYAGLSIIARVIFYFSAPIALVMFPLVVQKFSKNESNTGTFFLAILFVLLPSAVITLVYFLMPEFIMHIFGIKNITPEDKYLLGIFGIFISLYSLLSVLTNFFLSIKKIKIYIPIVLCAVLQIIGICLYHKNFLSIISISVVITFLLVCGLLIYYPYATKKK